VDVQPDARGVGDPRVLRGHGYRRSLAEGGAAPRGEVRSCDRARAAAGGGRGGRRGAPGALGALLVDLRRPQAEGHRRGDGSGRARGGGDGMTSGAATQDPQLDAAAASHAAALVAATAVVAAAKPHEVLTEDVES